MQHLSPRLDAWFRISKEVQDCSRVGCHLTRLYEVAEGERSPAGGVQVCPQQRLYTTYMLTDDPIWVVVGAGLTLRALRERRRLTNSVGLLMAIPKEALCLGS